MQKLALASIDVLSFKHLINKPIHELKVVFIPTAADTYANKWFVDRDRDALRSAGVLFVELDINGKTKEELQHALKGFDVVIVEGGNTFYLLQKVRESGFDEIIKELIGQGVIYVGSSAGAVLMCPTIEPVKYFDKPEDAPLLKNYEGLNFVHFLILPHFDPNRHDENYDRAIEDCKKLDMPYKLLTNDQSILIEGDTWRIASSK